LGNIALISIATIAFVPVLGDGVKQLSKLKYVDEVSDVVSGVAKYGDDVFDGLMDAAKTADVSALPNQQVFYSGAGNREVAEKFAELNGKVTLEMTPGGKYFESLNLFDAGSPVTKEQAKKIWSVLSEQYAQGASGNVYGFVNGSIPGSIFNSVEYPALQQNPAITNIFTELFN
jgi:hypothetical protein